MRQRTEAERNALLDHARRLEVAAGIIRTAVNRDDQSVESWQGLWGLITPVSFTAWRADDVPTPADAIVTQWVQL